MMEERVAPQTLEQQRDHKQFYEHSEVQTPRLARGYCTHCGVLLQFKVQNIVQLAIKVQCPKCSSISAFSVQPLLSQNPQFLQEFQNSQLSSNGFHQIKYEMQPSLDPHLQYPPNQLQFSAFPGMIQPYQNMYQLPPPPPNPSQNAFGSYSSMTVTSLVANHKVDELKEKCRRLGLRVGGTKSDLATRLVQYLQSSTTSNPPSPTLSSISPLPESPSTSPTLITTPSSPSKKRSLNGEETNNVKKLRQNSNSSASPTSPALFSMIEAKDTCQSYTPRSFHSAVLYEGKMYVFGGVAVKGNEKDPNNSVGVFDIKESSWSLLQCKGTPPSPRKNHTAVVYKDYMYIFGGESKTKTSNDLYSLSLKEPYEWKRIESEGPTPPSRSSHSAVVIGKAMYIFGGRDSQNSFVDWGSVQCHCEYNGEFGCLCEQPVSQVLDDLWEFSFESQKWRKEPRTNNWPCPRNGHAAISHNNQMYILAGDRMSWPELFDGSVEDLWCFDPETHLWENLRCQGESPKEMSHGKAVCDGQNIYVFNDENMGKKYIYRLDINKRYWEKCAKIPEWDLGPTNFLSRFQYHGMSVVRYGSTVLLLGDFGAIHDGNFAHLQKNLITFHLDNF